MFIKKSIKRSKKKTYTNHLLVESVATPQGPRHRVVCSLGSLEPAPKEEWLALAHRLQDSLKGQKNFLAEEPAVVLGASGQKSGQAGERLHLDSEGIEFRQAREAGPVHVGHQMWKRLGLDRLLRRIGFKERAIRLTELMTLNRLIAPKSEHAIPDWVRRTALGDILGVDFSSLKEDRLYRQLDRLYPERESIESGLVERERELFNLEETVCLYDLTSTYFEGQCPKNPKAKRGYSRDKRPDCKQLVVGLILDGEGFPKAHEIFEGNRTDGNTCQEMLEALERRLKSTTDVTVIVDRGIASEANLELIRSRGYHYLVTAHQKERENYLEELLEKEHWQEIHRKPSPNNPAQKKVRVFVKPGQSPFGSVVLCYSQGREDKDRAIRQKQQERLVGELQRLQERIRRGGLVRAPKVYEAIGRLRERYPRVARYYECQYDEASRSLHWQQNSQKKAKAEETDGCYLLKTDRTDWSPEQLWRTYLLLTHIESAFRDMKSPLAERPIFHQLQRRSETHIFLCLLAYHLQVCIERAFLDQQQPTSWASLRQELSTHQVVTVVLPTHEGPLLEVRSDTTPEPRAKEIYRTLRIPWRLLNPRKRWRRDRDEN